MAGSTDGVTGDATVTIDASNLVDQLEIHGKTWTAYMQSLPAGGDGSKLVTASARDLYGRKHDPFASYQDIKTNPARLARIVDFGQLQTDLTQGNLPDFAWITPDQCHVQGTAGSGPRANGGHSNYVSTSARALRRIGRRTTTLCPRDASRAIVGLGARRIGTGNPPLWRRCSSWLARAGYISTRRLVLLDVAPGQRIRASQRSVPHVSGGLQFG